MRWDSKVTVGSFKQVSCQGIHLLTIVAQSHPGDEWLPWWRCSFAVLGLGRFGGRNCLCQNSKCSSSRSQPCCCGVSSRMGNGWISQCGGPGPYPSEAAVSSTAKHQWEETQRCEGESSGLQNTCKCWRTQPLACHPRTQKVGARGPPAGLVGICKLGV